MEDLISRQRAIKAMDTWDKFGCDPNGMLVRYDDDKHYVPYVRYDDMVYVIKSLPSAEPEKGKWIAYKGMQIPERHGLHYCSNCCHSLHLASNGKVYNYCPKCGSKMEVKEVTE